MAQRYGLVGRVVTMDGGFAVRAQGAVYVDGREIRAVLDAAAPPPAGFAGAPRIETGGTIYPGLIELHNHLSYNALPLWKVPRAFQHRGQWAGAVEKRKLISGPMALLAEQPGYVEAVVRYVECKCLLAGVTTTQGVTLSSAPGIEQKYRGVVRNVEATDDPTALPAAGHRIGDVKDAASFRKSLLREKSCYFLHLSEGVTRPGIPPIARGHFLNLRTPDGLWAISSALTGIHAAGLLREDFAVLAENKGSMVWSPLSNLLLYGGTADVAAARAEGVRIGLGADWSPSGSKNLLGELKVARVHSELAGGLFSDRELVAMATIEAARILKWDRALGSLEAGKRADLIVVAGQAGGPYEPLLKASEAAIELVVIDGAPRYGLSGLMDRLDAGGEAWQLGGRERRIDLTEATDDPIVGDLTLSAARERLALGLAKLPHPPATATPAPIGAADGRPRRRWRLVLDNDGERGRAHRPLAPMTTAEVIAGMWAASVPLTELVGPIALDELTVAENRQAYFDRLRPQPNLPAEYKPRIEALYQN